METSEVGDFGYKDVLFVNNNLKHQKLFSEYLTEYEFSVEICNDEFDVLKTLKKINFGVIIIDFEMSEVINYQLIKNIRDVLKLEWPIVVVTKEEVEDISRKCFRIGVNACMSMPISKIDLVGILTQFLPNHRFKCSGN